MWPWLLANLALLLPSAAAVGSGGLAGARSPRCLSCVRSRTPARWPDDEEERLRGLEKRTVVGGQFAVFDCPVEAIGETYRHIFTSWLPGATVRLDPCRCLRSIRRVGLGSRLASMSRSGSNLKTVQTRADKPMKLPSACGVRRLSASR